MSTTKSMPAEAAFATCMARIDELLGQVAALPDPAARACSTELVQLVLELHGAGLTRMMALAAEIDEIAGESAGTSSGSSPPALMSRFADDEVVRAMLLVHDLHPVTLHDRVEQALETVRPMMRAHRGGVELLSVEGSVVQLRLEGSCNGCAASAATMRNAVEAAILEAAPEVTFIDVEGVVEAPAQRSPALDCLKPLPLAVAGARPLSGAPR